MRFALAKHVLNAPDVIFWQQRHILAVTSLVGRDVRLLGVLEEVHHELLVVFCDVTAAAALQGVLAVVQAPVQVVHRQVLQRKQGRQSASRPIHTVSVSVSVTPTLPLKNRAGFDFASIFGKMLSVHTHMLLPMEQRYAHADVWCEWAFKAMRPSVL